jgi:hypothetical protein
MPRSRSSASSADASDFRLISEATMASWIKCTNTKHEAVYINLDNAVTVTRNDVADRIAERGTVISFMGGEQVYIVVNEQPEEIIKTVMADRNSTEALLRCPVVSAAKKLISGILCSSIPCNRRAHSSMISECFHGVSFMKLRRRFPVMLGEYEYWPPASSRSRP